MRQFIRFSAFIIGLSAASGALAADEELSAEAVFERAWQSVVVVQAGESQGSGVIVGDDEVATNCHVIADDNRVQPGIVVLRASEKNGAAENPLAAELAHGNFEHDLCLLRVAGIGGKAAEIRDSATLAVGAKVYAVGAPQGLEYTLSAGIVSQLRALGGTPPLIQTDAAISSGSSGGGLFDAQGRLVGLTTLYYQEGQNLNFAVPTEWIAETRERRAVVDEKPAIGQSLDFLSQAIELHTAEDWTGLFKHCLLWILAEPLNAMAWYSTGIADSKLGYYDEAILAYRKSLRINPEDDAAWNNLGITYKNLNRHDEAVSAFREALHINPEYDFAWNNLGSAYDDLNRYDEAVSAFREALRINPEYDFAWNNLGITYKNLNRHDEAVSAFREALRINPEYDVAWNSLGSAYDDLNRYDEAVSAYREALRINPENDLAWNNLGITYAKLKRYDEAVSACREALRINPNAKSWYLLSLIYKQQGRQAEADEAHQKYMRLKILQGE